MNKLKCIFCQMVLDKNVPFQGKIFENKNYFVILDSYPLTTGHTLIIPKKHFSNLSELSLNLTTELFSKAIKMGELLQEKLKATAYVLKVNNEVFKLEKDNKSHVGHIHIHIIPRYSVSENLDIKTDKAEIEELYKIKQKILGHTLS